MSKLFLSIIQCVGSASYIPIYDVAKEKINSINVNSANHSNFKLVHPYIFHNLRVDYKVFNKCMKASIFSQLNSKLGFTLIEKTVLMLILGVIAATAVLRFVDTTRNAKISTLQAMVGAISSAAQIVRVKAILEWVRSGQYRYGR